MMCVTPGTGRFVGLSCSAVSSVASACVEESSPVSGVTSLGSDVAGTGGGSMRASSILWAPTVLVGTEASGLAALV